ncbi:ABC-type multidrug transport system, ATPase component [Caldibacillus debilis GB1]|jgi:ABC-2 type transport system ATP-binding protein|uniref:ABC-type multidrug transport system, ATPase component n=2 Tax=Caldibacillus debilis TaxID=301148 RepID=A0A420VH66_9BACI|nr:ABC-type multidrug transport system, ATPase component [Caldibacillus debilis GB1]
MEMGNRLSIENVSFSYGKNTVLDNISFTCRDGITALLGNNGAGKTTLMNILTGLNKPSHGRVMLNGIDLLKTKPYPIDQVGYLPQNFDVYGNVTGYDLLSYVFDLKKIKKNKKETIDEVVERFHLTSVINKRIGKYSGGYKRRLGIAQAVIGKPTLLIIDEPTAGLDPEERAQFRKYLSEISKDSITLISTHIIEDVELYSQQIVILKDHSIAFNGSVAEMIAESITNIRTLETDFATLMDLRKKVTIIEEKRLGTNRYRIRFIKDKQDVAGSYQEKEISLENAYIYFQNR